MRGKKNDFSMTFYKDDDRVLFLEFVHDTNEAIKWTEEVAKKEWTHAMVYNRRTREKIERIKNQKQ